MKVFTGMEREKSRSCLKVLLQEVQSCAPAIIRAIPPLPFFSKFYNRIKVCTGNLFESVNDTDIGLKALHAALKLGIFFQYSFSNICGYQFVKQEPLIIPPFLKLYAPCIILQYVYKPTRCTQFL